VQVTGGGMTFLIRIIGSAGVQFYKIQLVVSEDFELHSSRNLKTKYNEFFSFSKKPLILQEEIFSGEVRYIRPQRFSVCLPMSSPWHFFYV